jgi:uncharacterized protein (TIGR04222 family)
VLSALSSMRVAGTVSAYSDGTVRAEQSLDSNADELQQAIWMATADGPITRGDLVTHWIVATTLRKTRQRLEDAGLLLSADEQRRIKRAGWWMVGVGVVGVVRLVAGAAKGAPVNDLIQELFGVGIVAAVLLLRSAPRCSRRGTAELKRLRTEHHELAPGMRPDWTAYGPALAGLGVGIFGAKALWASDPAFAADIHAQQLAAGAGRFNYYGGGCGGGGGGCGGGGGGCGGGCGGGGGH